MAAHFDAKFFKFFRDLEKNNDREWFQTNKEHFQSRVQAPLIAFVGDFASPLKKISPHFIADPRPNGGSIFRIYRDTRFSKDKSPYKTWGAVHFKHDAGKDVHCPGFYLHLQPGEVFAGAGIWRPDGKTLAKIRDHIVEDPKALQSVLRKKAFKDNCTLGGDSLKRPPRGYDSEHPMIDHLKRKDWIVSASFSQKEACAPDFMKSYVVKMKAAAPFVRWLCLAIEQPF